MQVLGGNQVVFYASVKGNHEIQLNDCLEQLEEYMDENQIYPGSFIRHNIFVDPDGLKLNEASKEKLKTLAKRRFPMPLLLNVIPAKPAEGSIALESTHLKSTKWNCLFKEVPEGACQHIVGGDDEMVIGSVQVKKGNDFQYSVEQAFSAMETLLSKCDMTLTDLVRQWSYLERMFESDLNVQRYQIFHDIRTRFFEDEFNSTGYPATTEIGVGSEGIIIEFLARKNAVANTKVLNNPIQKAPHQYSDQVLSERGTFDAANPTTPKAERARVLSLGDTSTVFVSSTAAIVGEKVMNAEDTKEQTLVIIENLKKLISKENLADSEIQPKQKGHFTLLKVYLRNSSDAEMVYRILNRNFGDIPMVLIEVELPRKEMLLEIEAEYLL